MNKISVLNVSMYDIRDGRQKALLLSGYHRYDKGSAVLTPNVSDAPEMLVAVQNVTAKPLAALTADELKQLNLTDHNVALNHLRQVVSTAQMCSTVTVVEFMFLRSL